MNEGRNQETMQDMMVERKEEKKKGTKNWKKEDTSKNKGSTGNE